MQRIDNNVQSQLFAIWLNSQIICTRSIFLCVWMANNSK